MQADPDTRRVPELVAHRGYAGRYPENTLPAIDAALRAGVKYIEVDVQLTGDGVPVLYHDDALKRTTGSDGRITRTSSSELARLCAGETARLGERFRDTPIPTLDELMERLRHWPQAQAFIEIKQESLDEFGLDAVVRRVMQAIEPCLQQCIVISFNADALRMTRTLTGAGQGSTTGSPARIGWAIKSYSSDYQARARALAPDYLFCNYLKLPYYGAPLWPGPWRWVLYEVTDPAIALALARRGAEFVETMALDAFTIAPWSLRLSDES